VSGEPRTLLFFTESFPYDVAHEDTFVQPLLPSLIDAFGTVIVFPWRRGGGTHHLPPGVELEESLAQSLDGLSPWEIARSAMTSSITRADLAAQPRLLASPRAVKRLAIAAGRAEATRRWLDRFLASRAVSASRIVAFTFWFDHVTLGLALARSRHPDLVLATRVNGSDLYRERHRPPYLPGQRAALRSIDLLFAASEHANGYVRDRYPGFDRSVVARLGVGDPGFVSRPSDPGRLVIVSCSSLVPVKRVPLLARGLRSLAERQPETRFEWHHFGDGPARPEVEHAVRSFPVNASAVLHGHTSNSEIISFYRDEAVDLFVNASSSEGGAPVAVVEAASVGIPILATRVGGNPEIVSGRNGALLSADPTEDELADGVFRLFADPSAVAAKRAESRRIWHEGFRADVNARTFARRLSDIRGARR